MQMMLSGVGKTWHGSLADTILASENAPTVRAGFHWLILVAFLLTLFVLLPLYPVAGLLLFVLLSTGNVIYYYAGNDRARIGAFLDRFSSFLRYAGHGRKNGQCGLAETKSRWNR